MDQSGKAERDGLDPAGEANCDGHRPPLHVIIESFAEEDVEVVDGEGEVAEFLGGFVIKRTAFEFPFHAAEAFAEGEGFFGVAKVFKEAFYFFDALEGGADDAPGFSGVRATGFDAL